jgi:hypothetical protein
LVLVKCESGSYSEQECIKHNDKTDKAEPGKYLEVVLHDGIAQVFKGFVVNFFDK